MRVAAHNRSSLLTPIAFVALIFVAAAAFGQASYTAQVRGTVKDASGAVIAQATVTITNDATGIVSTAHSDDNGLYILTGLRPAVYTIKSEAAGFRASEQKGLVLQVDQQTSIDFVVKPPGVITTGEVTTASRLLATERPAIGTDGATGNEGELPVHGRAMVM